MTFLKWLSNWLGLRQEIASKKKKKFTELKMNEAKCVLHLC